jgi:hypothetical protein
VLQHLDDTQVSKALGKEGGWKGRIYAVSKYIVNTGVSKGQVRAPASGWHAGANGLGAGSRDAEASLACPTCTSQPSP